MGAQHTSAEFPRRTRCRIADAPLETFLDLGKQSLTGVFPRTVDTAVAISPVELAWCPESGLVQLAHDYPPELMYGETYGYRSGLNAGMVRHLQQKISILERFHRPLMAGDVVLDIGANDATTLKAYKTSGLTRLGIDPSAEKFRHFYPDEIKLEVDFFSAAAYRRLSDKPAKIITSIAMFYDLPDPIGFAKDIASVLDDDGIWHFEQSYLPLMLSQLAYDTACQEHLEYYSLSVVKRILDAAELKLVDVTTNDVNGGSFAVTAMHKRATPVMDNQPVIDWMLEKEARIGLHTAAPYQAFAAKTKQHARELNDLVASLKASGKRVMGLGASTKGNVVLQYAGLDHTLLDGISDVNPDKWGCVTPGTHIPIMSEADAAKMAPDYYLVLPWHFRSGIVAREAEFLSKGGKLLFPLPNIEVIGA